MKGIRYVSLYQPNGYGEAARRYLRGLVRCGVPLTWTPMVPGRSWGLGYEPFEGSDAGESWLRPYCNRTIDYDTVIVHTVPEYFPRWRAKEPDKRIFGCTVWETDRPPAHWIPLLNDVDGLMVPCRWNRDLFLEHGVTAPLAVIPHIPAPASSDGLCGDGSFENGELAEDHYVFYTIATWTARKALWVTIESYLEAFAKRDPVCLLIKTTERDFTRARLGPLFRTTRARVRAILRGRRDPPPIRLVTDELSVRAMLALHGRGDCYVALSRSEGWGMGAFDAAALGRAVVATRFGGHLDYLDEDSAYLVDCRLVPVEDSQGRASYSPDQHWAEPDRAHAARMLRHVFEHREEARARGALLAKSIRTAFDEAAIVRRLVEFVSA